MMRSAMKKTLVFFLILSMLTSMLTSCLADLGKKDETTASAGDSVATEPANDAEETTSRGIGGNVTMREPTTTTSSSSQEPSDEPIGQYPPEVDPNKKTLDIYLIAGQSNATGCTSITDLNAAYARSDEMQNGFSHVFYAGNSRSNGAEPRDRVLDWQKTTMGLGMSANHFGPEAGISVALSDYYNEETGRYAGIIKYAYGGSSLLNKTSDSTSKDGNWVPPSYQKTLSPSQVVEATGKMYRNFLEQVETNIREVLNQEGFMEAYGFEAVRICGLYWMQGCNDKSQPNEYDTAFACFVKDVRSDLSSMMKEITNSTDDCGASIVPIVVGTISETQNLNSASVESVNKTFINLQKSFATKYQNCYVVDNSKFVITRWENNAQVVVGSDQWHWNQTDMLDIGVNVGEALLRGAGYTVDENLQRVIKIYNAAQLRSIIKDSKADNYADTSRNKIYQLQNNINLNEGWDATLGVDGNAVTSMPKVPNNIWAGIPKFYGTFDGNGYTISGLYMTAELGSNGTLGFIGELCGGAIRNLTIANALYNITVTPNASNVAVGALVGRVSGASTIENVTVKGNICSTDITNATVSGTVAVVNDQALTSAGLTFEGGIYSEFNDTSVIRVGNTEELLAAITTYGDFNGLTLKLTADIDLNPGWSAAVTIGSTVQFPQVPSVVWPVIATFKGVLDGNGYTLSGIYSAKDVSGNSGAYGGLFNTLDGGTVKNLIIKNSFVLVTNSDWANDYNVHVGGIAGDVNAGSQLISVYMDAEVWFKSWDGCVLGGAFGHANGQYTVNGFAFAGRLGNTGLGNDVNYASASRKVFIAQITGNQNNKDDSTVRNSVCVGEIYTGKNSATHAALGINFPWKMKFVLLEKLDGAWLESRSDYQDAGFVFDETLGYSVPGVISDLLNNTAN